MVNGGRGEPEERDCMWQKGVVALQKKSGRGSQPPQQPQEQKIWTSKYLFQNCMLPMLGTWAYLYLLLRKMVCQLIYYSLCLPLHLLLLLIRVTVHFVPWKMKLLLLGFCMFTAVSVTRLHKGMLIIQISVLYLGCLWQWWWAKLLF